MQLKPLAKWNLNYVRALPAGEYDWLEFKSSTDATFDNEHLDKLSGVLSAFANYDGGYLIFGVKDPKNGSTELDGGLDLNSRNGLKSWLEDKLPMQTDPPLPKIEVHALPLKKGSHHGVVVVRVPPSSLAPHQARNGRYMSKRGSKLTALGSRAVLDIVHRRRDPVLDVSAHVNFVDPDVDEESHIFLVVTNVGTVMSKHIGLRIQIPYVIKGRKVMGNIKGQKIYCEDTHSIASVNNGINAPCFPQSKLRFEVPLRFYDSIKNRDKTERKLPANGELIVTVFGDNAQPREFRFDADKIVRIQSYLSRHS